MPALPSRHGLASLADAVNAVAPLVTLGFAMTRADQRSSIVFSQPFGFGEYVNTPRSPEETAEHSRRLECAADLLPALLHALDVRDVFDRLSEIAKRALPHDLVLLRLFNEDPTKITIYARSDRGSELGPTLPHHYPVSVTRAWEFDIIDDYTIHPLEKDRPPAKMGARSSRPLSSPRSRTESSGRLPRSMSWDCPSGSWRSSASRA